MQLSAPTPSLPIVRTALEVDIPAILAIQALSYPPTLQESAASFKTKLAASPSTCFVAVSGSDMLGYLITLPCTRETLPLLDSRTFVVPQTPDTLYIHDLAVAPRFRGRGIPEELLAQSLQRAAALHLQTACLLAVQGTALFWQKKHGFQAPSTLSGELRIKVRSYGEDAVFMERQL